MITIMITITMIIKIIIIIISTLKSGWLLLTAAARAGVTNRGCNAGCNLMRIIITNTDDDLNYDDINYDENDDDINYDNDKT